MVEDVGWGGSWAPLVVSAGALEELRNIAGPAPSPGKSWVMVNLKDGEFKWYTARTSRRPSYTRRSPRRRK